MSTSGRYSDTDEIDAAVRGSYREAATETVPAQLDARVLTRAREETSRNTRTGGLPRWLVPAALAGVIALGVSLNFRYSNTGVVPLEPAGLGHNPAESTPEQGGSADLATAVESTGRRLRALDNAMTGLAPANNPAADAAGDDGKAGRFCSTDDTASPDTWWTCIESLRRSGEADAAQIEIELFQEAFPGYLPAN